MTQIVVAQRMWQRRDSAANWTAANPVLAAGEIGIELGASPENTRFKIGTGSHPWTSLPYFDGKLVEMRANATHIQWRYVGAPTWTDLVALSALRGPQGVAGPQGLSAYQVAVAAGFAGTQAQWLASLKGEKGEQGAAGPPGLPSVRRVLTIPDTTSGSVACDWGAYDEIRVTLTTDTVFSFAGAIDGQGCVLKLRQDGTGGHSVTLPPGVRYNTVIPNYVNTQTPGRIDRVGFVYDGGDGAYDLVALVPGI